jgi:hypothetical protein
MPISYSMARGTIVVDENLENLIQCLADRNIKIIKVPKGTSDYTILNTYLSGRVFVTANTKDFIKEISSIEFGLISADNLKNTPPETLAKIISEVIIKYALWSKRAFLLVLHKNGKHEFKDFPT